VQAPQRPVPQPKFVPVMLRTSRTVHTKRMSTLAESPGVAVPSKEIIYSSRAVDAGSPAKLITDPMLCELRAQFRNTETVQIF
jgi:hypothetical protein